MLSSQRKPHNKNLKQRRLPLPKSVLRQHLLLLDTSRRLPLHRRTEEQTGSLHGLKQMTQVAPVSRVTVILNITTLRRIRQTVTETHLLHDVGLAQFLRALSLVQFLAAALLCPRHRHERVHFLAHDAHNGRAGVESGGHGTAGGFDSGDGTGGGAGNDQVDGLLEDVFCGSSAQELDALLGLVDAARLSQFADGDGSGWVDAALVDPFLDTVQVHRRQISREAIEVIN